MSGNKPDGRVSAVFKIPGREKKLYIDVGGAWSKDNGNINIQIEPLKLPVGWLTPDEDGNGKLCLHINFQEYKPTSKPKLEAVPDVPSDEGF